MDEIEIENLAVKAIKAENFSEARRLLEPLVNSDSQYTLTTLGWMHEAGKGVDHDKCLAAAYYSDAAKMGCLNAFNSLGRVLWADGKLTEARKAFKEGADLGHLGSMTWLGIMMISGTGGSIDVEHGELLVIAAAKEGFFTAKSQLFILEFQRSTSIFRHIIYHVKRAFLLLCIAKEYSKDPYSDKLF